MGASPQAQTRGNAPSPGRDLVFVRAVWPSPRARGEERRVPAGLAVALHRIRDKAAQKAHGIPADRRGKIPRSIDNTIP
jgi:hypothetical protein